MKTLILYQSFTGNTKMVTQRIENALKAEGITPDMIKVKKDTDIELYDYELIFLGTPVIQWLPAKPILEFIHGKLELHRKRGEIIPTSPKLPGKYAVCYCTYSGPHTGIREAVPAIKYMEQFFEHLKFSMLGEWYIVGEFRKNEILATQGVLGDTRGRPNENDLMDIDLRVKNVIGKIKRLTGKAKGNLPEDFIPKPMQFLSKDADVCDSFKGLVDTLQNTSSIDKNTQRLIKIALSAACKCKDCLKFHILEALKHGTTDIEIRDALFCGVTMGGTPYLAFAFEVLEELDLG